MLTLLLLAATIAGSVQTAVEKTLSEPPQLASEDPIVLAAKLAELEARVERNEKIRDDTVACIAESLIATGGDLATTELARDRCPECGEANPLGASSGVRNGLKFGQTGVEVGLCLLAAKHRAADPEKGHRHGKWVARMLRWAIVLNNSYAVISGRPLLKWGLGSREALEK